MVTKEEIIEAYMYLRKTNSGISDECLDYMKNIALREIGKPNRFDVLERLALAITERDEEKECMFGCGKTEWGIEKHSAGCPMTLAYKIIAKDQ